MRAIGVAAVRLPSFAALHDDAERRHVWEGTEVTVELVAEVSPSVFYAEDYQLTLALFGMPEGRNDRKLCGVFCDLFHAFYLEPETSPVPEAVRKWVAGVWDECRRHHEQGQLTFAPLGPGTLLYRFMRKWAQNGGLRSMLRRREWTFRMTAGGDWELAALPLIHSRT